jgi:hypothetical protein
MILAHASDPELKDFAAIGMKTKIMQYLPHDLLQRPELVEEQNKFLDSNCPGSCDPDGSMTSDNHGIFNNELQTCLPGSTNILNNEVLPFLWNNVSYVQHRLFLVI